MTHRWTRHSAESCRLTEEIISIAYDVGTGRYTFRDRCGKLHESAPYTDASAEDTELTSVSSLNCQRRGMIVTELRDPKLCTQSANGLPETFNDILPSVFIASPLYTSGSPAGTKSPPSSANSRDLMRERLINAVTKSTVLAMQNIVGGVMGWFRDVVGGHGTMTNPATDEKFFMLSFDKSIHGLDADKELFI